MEKLNSKQQFYRCADNLVVDNVHSTILNILHQGRQFLGALVEHLQKIVQPSSDAENLPAGVYPQVIPYVEWSPPSTFPLFEGFESGTLSSMWRIRGRIQTLVGNRTDAVTIQTKVVRSGKFAARLMVKKGYVQQPGYTVNGKQINSERTELDAGELPLLNKELWYGFSLYVPNDFPIVKNRLSISQWKQDGDSCKVKDPSPVLSIRFENGELRGAIRLDVSESSKEVYKTVIPKFKPGAWHDFIIQVKFADDGYARIWMNGEKVFNYTGRTRLRGCGNHIYHKIGLYRDELDSPMVMYVDNYMRSFGLDGLRRGGFFLKKSGK